MGASFDFSAGFLYKRSLVNPLPDILYSQRQKLEWFMPG
jgi:hypothetical protein